jgi:hypothetical protein
VEQNERGKSRYHQKRRGIPAHRNVIDHAGLDMRSPNFQYFKQSCCKSGHRNRMCLVVHS